MTPEQQPAFRFPVCYEEEGLFLLPSQNDVETVVQLSKGNIMTRILFADCQSNDNVTLFYGLAGIGYELIRYTDKNRFPTIL